MSAVGFLNYYKNKLRSAWFSPWSIQAKVSPKLDLGRRGDQRVQPGMSKVALLMKMVIQSRCEPFCLVNSLYWTFFFMFMLKQFWRECLSQINTLLADKHTCRLLLMITKPISRVFWPRSPYFKLSSRINISSRPRSESACFQHASSDTWKCHDLKARGSNPYRTS